ncbi:hypothetical protein SDC9_125321 [bioreactor metagenome]|uniref:DUF975 family protein n=1 Tax=bioreactor metagenome TaxID=1076179 RepID=A0A645CMN0_9ZZZZ
MNGQIKIYGKAILLNQYAKTTLVILISLIAVVFLGNIVYLVDFLLKSRYVAEIFENVSNLVVTVMIVCFVALTAVISSLVIIPLKYGREIWFYEQAKRNRQNIKYLFKNYSPKKSFKPIGLYFYLFFIKLGVFLCFELPTIFVSLYFAHALKDGISQELFIALIATMVVLFLIGDFFYFVFSQRYFLAKYILYENEDCRVIEALKTSTSIMEKKCFQSAMFKLSFFPWFLLYIFIAPAIYVYPYYKVSTAYYGISILSNRKFIESSAD